MTLKYVTIKKFAELTGYTENAIRSKISRGDWLENIVWMRPPGTTGLLIIIEGFYMWVEGTMGGNVHG